MVCGARSGRVQVRVERAKQRRAEATKEELRIKRMGVKRKVELVNDG